MIHNFGMRFAFYHISWIFFSDVVFVFRSAVYYASAHSRSFDYQRYKAYPPYCSDPAEMATRKIPPLPTDDNNNTRIVHVTAIIRHGARTPIQTYHCWDGYWEEPGKFSGRCSKFNAAAKCNSSISITSDEFTHLRRSSLISL